MTEREPQPTTEIRKRFDQPFAFRGLHDRRPEGVCRLRLFARGGLPPVIVLSELSANLSTSVTNMAEILAWEVMAAVCPERLEHAEPAVFIEHYPEQRDDRGRLVHEATWDVVSFGSCTPRIVWIGGQERVSLCAPQWRRLNSDERRELIGDDF